MHYSKSEAAAADAETGAPLLTPKLAISMFLSGASLGPWLDNYHSTFDVLRYEHPIKLVISGNTLLTTAYWVPLLFGVAGLLIGGLYVIGDAYIEEDRTASINPSWPKIFVGISFFTFQYFFSGFLLQSSDISPSSLFAVLTFFAVAGTLLFDRTKTGVLVSLATAIGGPAIEVGLISLTHEYRYLEPDFLGFFPAWIIPIYYCGGQAVGNLARGFKRSHAEHERRERSEKSQRGK